MAITSNANATWNGDLASGSGTSVLGSGTSFDMSWKARAEEGGAVTPEELIAGAHASCFSMALSHTLAQAGHAPESLATSAKVSFVAGEGITTSVLTVTGRVPGIDQEQFQDYAEQAKAGCPVSQALAGVDIQLESARLEG
ncbi:OsmC family peroxiredoxin [Agrococcus carbonis]|uniref:Osmotically inducible protein OsmC n=1 Tax=Agrococcus carbonis TaxID=684552 RepID=A0A1H1MZC4_9MICO|nr:OsmC family peroxiredoxin [Agrococcus carbonis]SDR91289.1 osmotically inducible protein OsmC [Agrococcus carbonis]